MTGQYPKLDSSGDSLPLRPESSCERVEGREVLDEREAKRGFDLLLEVTILCRDVDGVLRGLFGCSSHLFRGYKLFAEMLTVLWLQPEYELESEGIIF